jgi:hypothetical protein
MSSIILVLVKIYPIITYSNSLKQKNDKFADMLITFEFIAYIKPFNTKPTIDMTKFKWQKKMYPDH